MANLKVLGDRLDEAERAVSAMWAADCGTYSFSPDSVSFEEFERLMKRQHDAVLAYGEAVTERSRAVREKFKSQNKLLRARDAVKLRDKMYEAEARIDLFEELGPDFYTKREFIDANAAFVVADWIWDHAQERYTYRFAVGNHSRPVNDGYVKTGKFKMIDGERVPVLEKIE